MKFSIATLSLRLDLKSTIRPQKSSNVKDCILGFEISANNFRTNIAAGKSFTTLCFFSKGAPNYVYINLKRSHSNLALGQCKFDLRSMLKTSKLCQVVCHSTHLDRVKVFILLCGYSGSKDNYGIRN